MNNSGIDLVRTVSQPAQIELDWDVTRRFLRNYWRLMLAIFAATVVSGYAALSLYTEQYDVTTELLVKIGRENLDPPAVSRNMPLSTGLRREELYSEVEILRSPWLMEELVEKIGVETFRIQRVPPPGFFPRIKFEVKRAVRTVKDGYQEVLMGLDLKKRLPENQRVMQDLMERLAIEPRKDSDVIGLTLRYPDPQLGSRVLQELTNLYFQRRMEVRRNEGVREYLDARTARLRNDLEAADQEMTQWKRKQALVASPAEEKAVLLKQIEKISLDMGADNQEIENLTRQVSAARELTAAMPAYERTSEQTTPNPLVQSLRERIALLEADRVQALAKYQENSVTVRSIDEQLSLLKKLLAAEKTTQPGAVTSNVNAARQLLEQKLQQDSVRLAGLKATREIQRQQLSTLNTRMAQLDAAESVAMVLDRKRRIAEEDFTTVLRRRSEAEVSEQLSQSRISNISVLSPPAATLTPVYPPKLIAMALILAVGVLLAAGITLLMNYFDPRVRSGRVVEQTLGIPFLGELGPAELRE